MNHKLLLGLLLTAGLSFASSIPIGALPTSEDRMAALEGNREVDVCSGAMSIGPTACNTTPAMQAMIGVGGELPAAFANLTVVSNGRDRTETPDLRVNLSDSRSEVEASVARADRETPDPPEVEGGGRATANPEPSTYLLLSGGLLALARLRKTSHQSR